MQIRNLKNRILEFCVKRLKSFTGLLEKQIEPSEISLSKADNLPKSALDDWLERTADVRDSEWLTFENVQLESTDVEVEGQEKFSDRRSEKKPHKKVKTPNFGMPEIKRRDLLPSGEMFVRDRSKPSRIQKKNQSDKKEKKLEKTRPLLLKTKNNEADKRVLKKEVVTKKAKQKAIEQFKLLPSQSDEKAPTTMNELISEPEKFSIDKQNHSPNTGENIFKDTALHPAKSPAKKAPQINRSKLKTSAGGYLNETFRQKKSAKGKKFAERSTKRNTEKTPFKKSNILNQDKAEERKNKLPNFELKPKEISSPVFSKDRDVYLPIRKTPGIQTENKLQIFQRESLKQHKQGAAENKFPVMDEPKWIELPDSPETDLTDEFDTKQIEILHIKALESEQADLG